MFLVRILDYQITILMLMVAIVIVISMIVGYISIWRFRPMRAETDEGDTEWLSFRESISWFLIFTNIVIVGIAIAYTVYRIVHPPVW